MIMKKRARYHRCSKTGDLYRSVIIGFHRDTGEQLIVLKRLKDGTVWMLPLSDLKKVNLINGVPTPNFIEDEDYQEEYEYRVEVSND